MLYELSDAEWHILRGMLPNKPRGVARRVLNGSFGCCGRARPGAISRKPMAHGRPATTVSFDGRGRHLEKHHEGPRDRT